MEPWKIPVGSFQILISAVKSTSQFPGLSCDKYTQFLAFVAEKQSQIACEMETDNVLPHVHV